MKIKSGTALRQAAYRARHVGVDKVRISNYISPAADATLKRLARHVKRTQADVIEVAVREAEAATIAEMTKAEREEYFS
jgi:hypothetical protein